MDTGNPWKGASGSSGRGTSSAEYEALDPEDLSKDKHYANGIVTGPELIKEDRNYINNEKTSLMMSL